MSLVHLFPNLPVNNPVKPQKRIGAGVVAATVRAFQRLRQGCRVPLDVHSLEFVSAVVADKGFDSSNHSNSVLQVQRYRIGVPNVDMVNHIGQHFYPI